jgi:hypothetical protein
MVLFFFLGGEKSVCVSIAGLLSQAAGSSGGRLLCAVERLHCDGVVGCLMMVIKFAHLLGC